MEVGSLDQEVARGAAEPVLDAAREGLALAARAQHRSLRRVDQAGRSCAPAGFQAHRATQPGHDRARLERLGVNARGQSLGDPSGLGAGEGHHLAQASLAGRYGHGLAGAGVDADRQPTRARIDRQPQGAAALKRQTLTVPVRH